LYADNSLRRRRLLLLLLLLRFLPLFRLLRVNWS
jgi:hypothetical protein